jgi:hypothetical protein
MRLCLPFPCEDVSPQPPSRLTLLQLEFRAVWPRLKLKPCCLWTKQNGSSIEPLDQGGSRFSIVYSIIHLSAPVLPTPHRYLNS